MFRGHLYDVIGLCLVNNIRVMSVFAIRVFRWRNSYVLLSFVLYRPVVLRLHTRESTKPRCDVCGTACSKCGPAGQVQVSAGLAGSHSGGDTITGCGSCTTSPLKCPCFVFVYFCLVAITCLAYVLLLLLLLCDAVIYVAFNRLPRRGMQLCQRANDQTLCWCAGRMEEEK